MQAKTSSVITGLLIFVFLSIAVFAVPGGPGTTQIGTPDRRSVGLDNTTGGTNATGGKLVQAQAGNVTALNINSTRLTSRWQGYYGNVSGVITLDDASNNTLYNWQLASAQGEIYAANDSVVVWANIFCFNYTNNLSGGQPTVQRFNGTDLERTIGSNIYDRDSVNATFNASFTGSFQVGSTTINSQSGCRQSTLNVNDQYQTSKFVEVLLTDNNSIVYTALLEQKQTGFSGSALDFEMLVGENGDTVAATNYYFFVELS